MSDKPATLAEALVAFHTEAPHIPLNGENSFFKGPDGKPSKFATLGDVMSAVRPVLAKNGLAIMQQPSWRLTDQGTAIPTLRTTLLHTSGEREGESMLLAVDKPGPQAQGAALTYARRYAVLSILGLVGDEDDDGNVASAAPAKVEASSRFQQPAAAVKPDAEAKRLKAELLKLVPQHKDLIEQHADDKGWLERQIATAKANAK